MQQHQAIALLDTEILKIPGRKAWADLGCGSGTFTLALAHVLPPQSIIQAIDTNASALAGIPDRHKEIMIEKRTGDFLHLALHHGSLDGILMANSLHYVQDQVAFIQKAGNWLQPGGCFLIVEYDTDIANPWVPFPLSFSSLKKLFTTAGYPFINKIHESTSRYNKAGMYSAIIERDRISNSGS